MDVDHPADAQARASGPAARDWIPRNDQRGALPGARRLRLADAAGPSRAVADGLWRFRELAWGQGAGPRRGRAGGGEGALSALRDYRQREKR